MFGFIFCRPAVVNMQFMSLSAASKKDSTSASVVQLLQNSVVRCKGQRRAGLAEQIWPPLLAQWAACRRRNNANTVSAAVVCDETLGAMCSAEHLGG